MAVYCDDYSICDTDYIVHAVPIDPCTACDDEDHDHSQEYLIGLILSIGDRAFQVAHTYPTKGLRDAAFEAICTLVQREKLIEEEEEL